jgi:thiol-disulfide isomerase/thioredoxin
MRDIAVISRPLTLAGALAAALLTLAACGAESPSRPAADAQSPSTTAPAPKVSPNEARATSRAPAPSQAPGSYVDYSAYTQDKATYDRSGAVVLFFHASWCPSCRQTEEALTSQAIPDGLTVVKTDFDTSTTLRQKYGVTVQHTFVQVAPDGSELAKWTGSVSPADIAAAVKTS